MRRNWLGAAAVAVAAVVAAAPPAGAAAAGGGTITFTGDTNGINLTPRATWWTFTPIALLGVAAGIPGGPFAGMWTTTTISAGSASESCVVGALAVNPFTIIGTGPVGDTRAASMSGTMLRVGTVGLLDVTGDMGINGVVHRVRIVAPLQVVPSDGNCLTATVTRVAIAGTFTISPA